MSTRAAIAAAPSLAIAMCGCVQSSDARDGGENVSNSAAADPLELRAVDRPGDADALNRTEALGGCTFRSDGAEALLIVGVPSSPSMEVIGVARIAGRLTTLHGDGVGPDSVRKGPVMRSGGVTLTVRHGDGEGQSVGPDARRWPAELTVRNSGGESRTYSAGGWSCNA